MKIVDAFIFYNELDILEFRLLELNSIVDHFVIVESSKTFAGKAKQLFYENHKERYAKWANKIIHIVVDDMPDQGSAWDREYHQRNAIDRGIRSLDLADRDIVMISDLDEIPDVKTVSKVITNLTGGKSLAQDMFYYNLECKARVPWYLAKIMPFSVYKTKTPQQHRSSSYPGLANGGWHFSYFGDEDFIVNKIQQFSHQEFNNPTYTNKELIKKRIANCQDLFGRPGKGGPHGFHHLPIEKNSYLPVHYQMLNNRF